MIHDESNVWSAAQRQKKIYGFDVHSGFEGNYGSVDYGKQCLLAWSCVEVRGWSRLKKRSSLDFEVEGGKGGVKGHGKSWLRKKV